MSDTTPRYIPPAALLLKALGITADDLKSSPSVTVSSAGLRRLIGAFAASAGFDPVFYAEAYPDVQGALLAGDLASLETHFARSGYLEGRLPAELPCDPLFYADRYPDLAAAYGGDNVDALVAHYRSRGYHEGRAGVPEHFEEAETWVHGFAS